MNFDKMFRKTIMLRPTPEGILVASNVTGIDKIFMNEKGANGEKHALEMNPNRIYRVRGLPNIDKICIHDYNTPQLKDLFKENSSTMSEKTLSDMLERSEAAGKKQAEGEGQGNIANDLRLVKIFSLVAALIGLYMAMKK